MCPLDAQALQGCYLAAEAADESSLAVFMINNLSVVWPAQATPSHPSPGAEAAPRRCWQVLAALAPYEAFAVGRTEMLRAQVEAHVETLVSSQASQVLRAPRQTLSHQAHHVTQHAMQHASRTRVKAPQGTRVCAVS